MIKAIINSHIFDGERVIDDHTVVVEGDPLTHIADTLSILGVWRQGARLTQKQD